MTKSTLSSFIEQVGPRSEVQKAVRTGSGSCSSFRLGVSGTRDPQGSQPVGAAHSGASLSPPSLVVHRGNPHEVLRTVGHRPIHTPDPSSGRAGCRLADRERDPAGGLIAIGPPPLPHRQLPDVTPTPTSPSSALRTGAWEGEQPGRAWVGFP